MAGAVTDARESWAGPPALGAGGLPRPSSRCTPWHELLTALCSSVPPAWAREEAHCTTSSGDDTDMDVEGLRKRRGREPGTPQPAVPLGVEDRAGGEGVGGELGISLNMCLLGALVLLGLGVLLFSGEWCLPAGSLNSALALLPPALPSFQPSSEGLTMLLCLHPQVASKSRRAVSGQGPGSCVSVPSGS